MTAQSGVTRDEDFDPFAEDDDDDDDDEEGELTKQDRCEYEKNKLTSKYGGADKRMKRGEI